MRIVTEDGDEFEMAYSMRTGVCDDPKCTAIHFDLYDEEGKIFARATLALEHLDDFILKLEKYRKEILAKNMPSSKN
jgi:hypothetical protein